MSQMEELKVFFSERLHAAASEIFGAVEKTITDYEEKVTRLTEENDRNRSLLDIILKTKSSQKEEACPAKSTPDAAAPGASDSSLARKARDPSRISSDSQCSFTSRANFLNFATSDDCCYCLKRIQATEAHLMRKHYLFAVHFTEGDTDKFVVPCTCEDLIQGRSHWHCPYCTKIIYRKCNFEVHISKQHGFAILQQSQDTEIHQPSVSAIEEDAPLSPQPWCQQELGSLDQEDQQASLLLQVKEEEPEMCRQVSHPEWQNSVQVKIEGEQMRKGNSQMSVEEHHAHDSEFSVVCADGYIQDLSEINSVGSSKGHMLPNSSNQPLETLPDDDGVGGICQPAGESQHTTPRISLKAPGIKRKVPVKRYKSKLKTSTLSLSQNPTGPHCCKACGKTFYYMYTLRAHMLTHGDTIHICGICGKHLESMESFVQHIQSHTKRNKCGICGKQFSTNSRLIRHRRFHRPKGLNVISST